MIDANALEVLQGTYIGISTVPEIKCLDDQGKTLVCCSDEPIRSRVEVRIERNDDNVVSMAYTYKEIVNVFHSLGHHIFQPIFSWTLTVQEIVAVQSMSYIIRSVNTIDTMYCLHVKYLSPTEMHVSLRSRHKFSIGSEGDPVWGQDYWCGAFLDQMEVGGCIPGTVWPENTSTPLALTGGWQDSAIVLERISPVPNDVFPSDDGPTAPGGDDAPFLTIGVPILLAMVLVASLASLIFVAIRRRRQRKAPGPAIPDEGGAGGARSSSGSGKVLDPFGSPSGSDAVDLAEELGAGGGGEDKEASVIDFNHLSENAQSTAVWNCDVDIVAQGLQEHWLINSQDITIDFKVVDQGGFGDVRTGMVFGSTKVAIKTCKSTDKAKHFSALANEMRLLRRIRHPNIVLFFGVCVMPGAAFGLILEWVEGMNLRGYTKKCNGWLYLLDQQEANPAPDDEQEKSGPNHKAKLLLDVVVGVQFLHAQRPQIIHRDLKPANVLVETIATPPRAKLTDFGVSMMLRGSEGEGRAGTRTFMAPEVLKGDQWNASADVYSFGCTCYYTLLGRMQGESSAVLRKALHKFLSKIDAPPSTCDAMVNCLQEVASDRPSFVELRLAFEAWKSMDTCSVGASFDSNSLAKTFTRTMVTKTAQTKTLSL